MRRNLLNNGLPKGIHRTSEGHLRYHYPRALRNKYVHRQMIEDMIAATPFSVRIMLPWPYEVHHQDYNKEHNCGCNFILLSESMHSYMTSHNKRKRFQAKWTNPPEWVLFGEEADSVPF